MQDNWSTCSINTCFSPLQKTKDYIRRAKAWRNSVWSGKDGRPSSFLMSLLVVRAYENAGRDGSEPAGLVTI